MEYFFIVLASVFWICILLVVPMYLVVRASKVSKEKSRPEKGMTISDGKLILDKQRENRKISTETPKGGSSQVGATRQVKESRMPETSPYKIGTAKTFESDAEQRKKFKVVSHDGVDKNNVLRLVNQTNRKVEPKEFIEARNEAISASAALLQEDVEERKVKDVSCNESLKRKNRYNRLYRPFLLQLPGVQFSIFVMEQIGKMRRCCTLRGFLILRKNRMKRLNRCSFSQTREPLVDFDLVVVKPPY